MDSNIRFRFGISPTHVKECVTKRLFFPWRLLCPLCKNEIEDDSHALFRCSVYNCFRKDVNIIIGAVHDTSNPLSRVMATDDEG